ncbi:hypothetical protein NM208_g4264 [Fusarium decemcellulare]|uniref:Uncharacterized protein n=1 Tax=Fusarium decemcellulare TaxID=57161 RepID=A0ACC1SL80_9HYPO|nr:hypothetical protein NM208_g4264 [Fusarium decemcellulare]
MTPVPSDENEADSRRAKKRELDRRAQRAARERNRNRIALLEATIEAMKKEDSGRKAAQLIEELTQVKKERDDLENTLQSIKDLITPHAPFHTSSNPTRNPPPPNKQPEVETGVTSDASPSEYIGMTATMNSIFDARTMASTAPQQDAQFMIGLDGELPLDPSFIPLSPLADGLIVPEPMDLCDCMLPPAPVISTTSSSTPKTSIWRKANEILGLQYPLSESMLQVEDELCEDLPVRVLLDGWGSFNTQNLPLLWQTLRQTDILQFQTCSDTERLAILVLMHRLLRYRADTAAENWSKIPPWLLSRPSQSLPHSPAIDFFVWLVTVPSILTKMYLSDNLSFLGLESESALCFYSTSTALIISGRSLQNPFDCPGHLNSGTATRKALSQDGILYQRHSRADFFGRTSHRMQNPSAPIESVNSDCMIFCGLLSFTGCAWIYNTMKRREIREKYGIEGSGTGDCCTSFWCLCCALVQQDNEVKARRLPGYDAQGYQPQKDGMQMP